MDHKLALENPGSTAVYTLPNTIINLKAIKYSNIRMRQIYQTDLELKMRLYYSCKDSGLLYWKLKMLW